MTGLAAAGPTPEAWRGEAREARQDGDLSPGGIAQLGAESGFLTSLYAAMSSGALAQQQSLAIAPIESGAETTGPARNGMFADSEDSAGDSARAALAGRERNGKPGEAGATPAETRAQGAPNSRNDGAAGNGRPSQASGSAAQAGNTPAQGDAVATSPHASGREVANPAAATNAASDAGSASRSARADQASAPAGSGAAAQKAGSVTGTAKTGDSEALAGQNARADGKQLLKKLASQAKPEQPLKARQEAPASQVSKALAKLVTREGGSMTLRLKPETLGAVRIELSVRDGHVDAVIRAESEQARRLLNAGANDLRAALETRGLQVDRLAVELRESSTSGRDGAGSPFSQTGREGRHEESEADGRGTDAPPDRGASEDAKGEDRETAHGGGPARGGSAAVDGRGNDGSARAERGVTDEHAGGAMGGVWAEAGASELTVRLDAVA